MKHFSTDIAIIGAGPCGLFTVFEAGLLKMNCHLIDYLAVPGGQLSEIYPKKPIYDIPGHPEILAKDLVDKLLQQIEPFKPQYTLGERAEQITNLGEEGFELITNLGTRIHAKVIAIAAGLGCFEPRKPEVENLDRFENNGIDYIIKDPQMYLNKRVVIAGGGDSALDWCLYLADVAKELTLIHRRSEFRAAPESVSRLWDLVKSERVRVILNAEVKKANGAEHLESLTVATGQDTQVLVADHFIPLFGLSPKLGPLADWGLQVHKNAIEVNPFDYSTSVPGIFAIGDINNYPGKLKLILCGFHEATLMVQSAYKIIHKGKIPSFKYTTVTGITSF